MAIFLRAIRVVIRNSECSYRGGGRLLGRALKNRRVAGNIDLQRLPKRWRFVKRWWNEILPSISTGWSTISPRVFSFFLSLYIVTKYLLFIRIRKTPRNKRISNSLKYHELFKRLYDTERRNRFLAPSWNNSSRVLELGTRIGIEDLQYY